VRARIDSYNSPPRQPRDMLSLEHDCPDCGDTRTFYRAASTTVQLGTKVKWRCPDCGYSFVRIDGVDSSGSVTV
jgi:transposase-like protein